MALSSPVKVSLLLDELDPHLLFREPAHDRAEVIEVAGQAVHRVDENGVTVSGEIDHPFQLGPVHVFT